MTYLQPAGSNIVQIRQPSFTTQAVNVQVEKIVTTQEEVSFFDALAVFLKESTQQIQTARAENKKKFFLLQN